MAYEVELQDEIEALIQPWRDAHDKPPFSNGELIVMALAIHEKPLTLEDIVQWLSTTFRYFDRLVFMAFWDDVSFTTSHRYQRGQAKQLVKDLMKMLHSYELPVEEMPRTETSYRGDSRKYSISSGEARIYLANQLAPERKGSFPFLSLPPELRNSIYDMVASYPRDGLLTSPGAKNHVNFCASGRDFSNSHSALELTSDCLPELAVHSVPGVLRFCRVSKQIQDEFTSVFFKINTFYFVEAQELYQVLDRMSASASQHLAHLVFPYQPYDYSIGPIIFRRLATLKGLRKLDIVVNETAWKNRYRFSANVFDLLKLPGFSVLRKIRGLEQVTFHSDCEELNAVLKPEMEQPAKETKAAARKRKAEEAPKGERKQPRRAAKAAKTTGAQLV